MKTKLNYLLAGLGLIIAPLAFAASNEEQSTDDTYQLPDLQVEGIDSLPVPVHQITPRVGQRLVGTTMTMKFTVNKKGTPVRIRSARSLCGIWDPRVRDFAVQMTTILGLWRFEPARDPNGQAVSIKLSMPVKVVEKDGTYVALLDLILDESS